MKTSDEQVNGVAAPAAPKSLVMKLAEVMAAVERVPKNGWNDFHKYHYATEADIAEAIRKELAARHVILIPSIESMVREAVGEKGQVLTTLTMTFTFLDGETGAELKRAWMGAGTDKEDKGLYKATTGGEKYFLLKTFLVPTGDDPEKHDAGSTAAASPEARRGRQQGPKIGVPIEQVGDPNRKSVPTTDAEIAQAFPPGMESDEPRDPRPDFLAGKLECPNCGQRVYKRKDGSAWFCWQQKGGCGGQWRAAPANVNTETGEITPPTDPKAVAMERAALVTRARKLAELVGLTADEMKTSWRTYCGDTTKETANPADVRLYISWLETRWEAKQKSA